MDAYENCLITASPKKLCKRGYCSAKSKYAVYPSAYANNYAVQVCRGKAKDYRGKIKRSSGYEKRASGRPSSLRRWNKEAWVNVCEKGDGPGGYKVCGSGKGLKNPKKYPYCRPYYKLKGTRVVTARELSASERASMCRKKRALTPGVGGKPTRVTLPKKIRSRRKSSVSKAPSSMGSPKRKYIPIPSYVRKDAKLGIKLMDAGFKGGTETGWKRAKQLANDKYIDPESLRTMRAWYARHGPDAKSGGTSYPGYLKWVKDGRPMDSTGKSSAYRGAVAWLIWGGDGAYKWLKTAKIRNILDTYYPR